MRIQPHHHDGEGTDASLYEFMTGLGHEAPATIGQPILPPASRDIAATVQRWRACGITPPATCERRRRDRRLTLILLVANAFVFYVLFAVARAYLAGRI